MKTEASNELMFMEASASGILERVYPCRCGKTHKDRDLFDQHQCFHEQLSIIDSSDDGKLVVYCASCRTAWLAPVLASGLSVKFTKSAMQRGCEWCRSVIFDEMKKDQDVINYDCPKCKEKWSLTKQKQDE